MNITAKTTNRHTVTFCLALTFIVLATYWQVMTHDFINFDDNIYIYENSTVKNGLTANGLIWSLTSSHASNWHPVTWISHLIDVQIFGLKAGFHHLVNVLFHLANALILFLFLNATTKKFGPSCLVSLLFALHPLHVESVAWASERKDVLSTFFLLLTLINYARYAKSSSITSYSAVFLLCALGLMSKPMLVTLPLLLLLLDFWPLNRYSPFSNSENIAHHTRESQNRLIISLFYEKIPLFVLAVLSSFITFLVQQQSGAVKSFEMMPASLRLSNAFVSYINYLWKMVWPVNLAILYPYPDKIPLWQPILALVIIIGGSIVVLKKRKEHPYLAVGWFWYMITMLPVIGFIQVGVQAMADRYTYIPFIGIFIMISYWTNDSAKTHLKAWYTLWCAIAICLSFFSWKQVGIWKDSTTVFSHTLDVTSDNYTAHNYLAKALADNKEFSQAEMHYREALKIRPTYIEALVNLGVMLAEQDKTEEAYPYLFNASQKDPTNKKIHNNLGNIYKNRGDLKAAETLYRKALTYDQEYKEALFNLANTLEKQDLFAESISYYQRVLRLYPDFSEAHNGLGVALARNRQIKESIIHFKRALQLRPDYQQAKKNLSLAQEQAKNAL